MGKNISVFKTLTELVKGAVLLPLAVTKDVANAFLSDYEEPSATAKVFENIGEAIDEDLDRKDS